MKIFDFSDGKKGARLSIIQRANSTGSSLVRKGEKTFKVSLANKPQRDNEEWRWHQTATFFDHASQSDMAIKPEDFGVEAICFCWGQLFAGPEDPKGIWNWCVIGTQDWNRNACKNKILKAEVMK